MTNYNSNDAFNDFEAMWNEDPVANDDTTFTQKDSFGFEDINTNEEDFVDEHWGSEDGFGEDTEESDIEDLVEVPEVTYNTLAEQFDTMPDNLVFNINGRTITKAELTQLSDAHNRINTAYSGLSNFSREMEAQDAYFREKAYAVQLEADRELAALYKQKDDPYITDAQLGQIYKDMQAAKRRKEIVDKEASAYTAQVAEREKALMMQRFTHMDTIMGQRHKDWGSTRASLGLYIQESGVPQQDLARALSPELAEVFRKAQKYDQSVAETAASLTKVAQKPAQKRQALPNQRNKRPANTPRKVEAQKRFESGQYDARDVSDMFDLLED